MIYRTIQPSPKLKDYVRFYWFLESDQAYTHYAEADVCPELVFHFKGRFDEVLENGKRELSFISGINAPTSQTRKFETDSGFGIFGIYLYPHAIPQLFGIPASEVTDRRIELDALIQPSAADLEDKIINSPTDERRITIIESFIEERLAKAQTTQLPVFEALKHIMKAQAAPKVNQLSLDYFISERQLERQFLRFTGFNPKKFIRIARFQRAIQFYGNREKRLTDIALDCGYYDLSHFINDFKQFSGIGPREFFSGESPATQWRD